ncbi:hypothetical protein [Pseudomonas brassicacearum]|uniref:hypothetical protein n=1 Tax=Pseudomonas brassicacearum TaxID=930166 RepID=UPI001BDE85C0|nr:hypothetical protein [Pseudomonas brassicacearum]
MKHLLCDGVVHFVGIEPLPADGMVWRADKKKQRKLLRYGKLTSSPDPSLRGSVINDQKHEIQP